MKCWHYILMMVLSALSSCAIQPGATHQPVRYYDFGAPLISTATCQLDMRLGKITVSPALQGNRIWYRLSSDPFEPRAYAISLWAASPAELMRKHLHTTFQGANSNAYVDVQVMRMELEVSSDHKAITILELNATSHYGHGSETYRFSAQQPSQASPSGAAAAFAKLLGDWRNSLCQLQEANVVDSIN